MKEDTYERNQDKKCNEIVSKEEKLRNEHEAIIKVIGDLVKKNELISLLSEFEERKTREAIFAYHCDKLEADLQSKVYQDMGCHHSLDDQDNNVSCMSIIKSNILSSIAKNLLPSIYWYLFFVLLIDLH